MSPDPDGPNPAPINDEDLGEPIAALLDLQQDVSASFLDRVRRRIYRRSAASQFASFSWHLPGMILVEFWSMLIQVLNPGGDAKGERS